MSSETWTRPRCGARTAAGTRCRKWAQEGSDRCAHHGWSGVPGRPSKLTPDVADRIIAAVLEGNYLATAAQAVGVGESTLYRWLQRGADVEARALERAEDLDAVDLHELTDPAEWAYLDFREALKSAEAYAERELLGIVRQGRQGWQAHMTILERRHPDRWGRRQALDHSIRGELDRRTTVELVIPDDDERTAEVARILAEAGALGPEEGGA